MGGGRGRGNDGRSIFFFISVIKNMPHSSTAGGYKTCDMKNGRKLVPCAECRANRDSVRGAYCITPHSKGVEYNITSPTLLVSAVTDGRGHMEA